MRLLWGAAAAAAAAAAACRLTKAQYFFERTKTLGKMYVDFEHPSHMQYVTPHVGGANTKEERITNLSVSKLRTYPM